MVLPIRDTPALVAFEKFLAVDRFGQSALQALGQ
jgi:hypothetical protein